MHSNPTRAIFLDFDGVLHPAGGKSGESLPFCWIPELAEELLAHDDVRIVIHSSWLESKTFDLDAFREFLGPLGNRLLGTVDPGPKPNAIRAYLSRTPQIRKWLVIDDDAEQFGEDFPIPILACDPLLGLGDLRARQHLRGWLNMQIEAEENNDGND